MDENFEAALTAYDAKLAEGGTVAQAAFAASRVLDLDAVEAFNLLLSRGAVAIWFVDTGHKINGESLRFSRVR